MVRWDAAWSAPGTVQCCAPDPAAAAHPFEIVEDRAEELLQIREALNLEGPIPQTFLVELLAYDPLC